MSSTPPPPNIAELCDTGRMLLSSISTQGERSAIFADPQHDYTRLLLSSVPGAKAL